MSRHHDVAIIGGGFSGIGAGIKLDEAGFRDFVILEQWDDIGGAWHANTYPGVAVDIPSFTYSFSFEPNPDWSRVFAPGAELKRYAQHCVDKYGLRNRIRLNSKVIDTVFDEKTHLWHVKIEGKPEVIARHVIAASGLLTKPRRPDIPGLDSFAGKVIHTATWDHGHRLNGERVAIIGTGASALQVIPAIAPVVKQLDVYQRTPIWVIPKMDADLPEYMHRIFRRLPLTQRILRYAGFASSEALLVLAFHYHRQLPLLTRAIEKFCIDHLHKQVADPVLRAKLTPAYGFGCKRPSFSNTYFPSFLRENVELVTDAITAITPDGIRTADGRERKMDTLILATGFQVFDFGNIPPFPVHGVGGTDLGTWWDANRYQSYQGVSVPGFPNFFTILGPYGFNGTSYFALIEDQMRHIVRCLGAARDRGASYVDVTRQANDRYFREMLRRRPNQVFFNNSCGSANSYYFDRHGDVQMRPATSLEAWWRSGHFNIDDYEFRAAPV